MNQAVIIKREVLEKILEELRELRQMLSSDNIEYGLLENGKLVVRIDKELFELDLSLLREALFTQNDSISGNPLLNVMKKLGITFFQKDFMERIPRLFSEAQRDGK